MRRAIIPALAATLTLAACGSSQPTTTSTSNSNSNSSTTTTPAGRPTVSVCAPSQLRLAYVGTEGATGHLEVTLALRNVSSRPCTLRGYPRARLLGPGSRTLPLTVKRGGGFFPDTLPPARTVVLAAGGRARFGISFVTNNEYAGSRTCHTATVEMSSAPGSTGHWWQISLHGAPRISPCGGQVVVSPVHD